MVVYSDLSEPESLSGVLVKPLWGSKYYGRIGGLLEKLCEDRSPAEIRFEKLIDERGCWNRDEIESTKDYAEMSEDERFFNGLAKCMWYQWPFGFAKNNTNKPHFYFADFFLEEYRLIIEIDGKEYHYNRESASHDMIRDGEFLQIGIETMRFSASEVFCEEFIDKYFLPRFTDFRAEGYIEGCSLYMSQRIVPEHPYSRLSPYRNLQSPPKIPHD